MWLLFFRDPNDSQQDFRSPDEKTNFKKSRLYRCKSYCMKSNASATRVTANLKQRGNWFHSQRFFRLCCGVCWLRECKSRELHTHVNPALPCVKTESRLPFQCWVSPSGEGSSPSHRQVNEEDPCVCLWWWQKGQFFFDRCTPERIRSSQVFTCLSVFNLENDIVVFSRKVRKNCRFLDNFQQKHT